jgi:hypothetical protein
MIDKKDIFLNPDLFLSHFEQAEAKSQVDNANFVRLSELDYRSPVFLQKISTQKATVLSLSVNDILEEYAIQQPVNQTNAHIFHSAFCCSTLLSSLLDYKNRTLMLKEPMVYLQMANWRRGMDNRSANEVNSIYSGLLNVISSTMATGYYRTEQSVIKHHNLVTYIIDDVLATNTNACGLYIYSDLKSFIISVLKSKGRRDWLKDQIEFSYTDAETLNNLQSIGVSRLDDVTAASYLWLMNIAKYRQASKEHGSRLCSLNNNHLLSNPADVALRAANHLGLDLDKPCINEKITYGVLERHAKTPQIEYGNKQRKSEMSKLAKQFKAEIKRGQKWAQKQAGFSIAEELPNPLYS